jgi:hypothetical protein
VSVEVERCSNRIGSGPLGDTTPALSTGEVRSNGGWRMGGRRAVDGGRGPQRRRLCTCVLLEGGRSGGGEACGEQGDYFKRGGWCAGGLVLYERDQQPRLR